jgi:hypothetical protein
LPSDEEVVVLAAFAIGFSDAPMPRILGSLLAFYETLGAGEGLGLSPKFGAEFMVFPLIYKSV